VHFLKVKRAGPLQDHLGDLTSPSPIWALSQAGTSDACSAAKDRGSNADKAMTMPTIFRKMDLNRTGLIPMLSTSMRIPAGGRVSLHEFSSVP
jgi:hypothetical protein